MTRRDEIERDLVEICSAVLEHPVDATASRATDAAWDSLRHMQVIFAVGKSMTIASRRKRSSV